MTGSERRVWLHRLARKDVAIRLAPNCRLKVAEDQKKLFVGMLKIKWVMELYDDIAELSETTKRTTYAGKLQTRLERCDRDPQSR